MSEETKNVQEMTEEQKAGYNAGYIKGCRDTIQLFTNLGVNLTADILNMEKSLAPKTEEQPSDEAPSDAVEPEVISE